MHEQVQSYSTENWGGKTAEEMKNNDLGLQSGVTKDSNLSAFYAMSTGKQRRVEGAHCLHFQGLAVFFVRPLDPECDGNKTICNASNHVPVHTTKHPRRPESSS